MNLARPVEAPMQGHATVTGISSATDANIGSQAMNSLLQLVAYIVTPIVLVLAFECLTS